MSEIYTIPELREALSPIFGKYGIHKAVLFGSYGKGRATPKSDIDLLVDSRLRGLRFMVLLDDIQSAIGKEVDLFDVSHIEPGSLIDREIRTTGVLLYEQ